MFLNGNEEFESRIVSDKVGYAKILVLDAENYQKLESGTASKWQSSSLLNSSGTFNTDELKNSDQIEDENWSQLDKTIYAYKEFAEMYEKYGIAGNIIYIDGFKCELPDEEYKVETEDKNADEENSSTVSNKEKPSGKPLTKSDFNVSSSALEDENELIQTKYEKDDEYKLSSKKVTERLNAEIKIKDMASCAIGASNITFIKEGTVIGRTFTDKEIVEDLRGEKYDDYIKAEEEEESSNTSNQSSSSEEEPKNKLIGNYIRIIMRDLDDTVVENIEDYMKLADGERKKSRKCDFEQFAFFLGALEESFNPDWDLGDAYISTNIGDGATSTAFGLTEHVAEIVKSEYPDYLKHLLAARVPKQEAQDVFIFLLEAHKEYILSKLNTKLEDDDTLLFALIDLRHYWPVGCDEVIDKINAGGGKLSDDEIKKIFAEKIGQPPDSPFYPGHVKRAINRGILATEGKFLLYQQGSEGAEVTFKSDTPWSDFCDGGGTYEMLSEGKLYELTRNVYTDYP